MNRLAANGCASDGMGMRYHVLRVWWTWLNRRSRRNDMPWVRFELLLQRYPFPEPVIFRPF